MKQLLVFFLCLQAGIAAAQAGLWTWMSGDTIFNTWGVYGPEGVASSIIYPPARHSAISWTDTAGNFWIYGGATPYVQGSPTTSLADLWKFDPLANVWTYVAGTPFDASTIGYGNPKAVKHSIMDFDSINKPGAAQSSGFSWVTPDNHFWFLNGLNTADFWQYDPATNRWAWMGDWPTRIIDTTGAIGSSPGRRMEGCAWVGPDGNPWLFGGYSSAMLWQGYYSDFLYFDRQAMGWIWKAGAVDGGQPSAPGPLDIASTTYTPGSRACFTYWQDTLFNFYLSGGFKATGPFNGAQLNYYQDVWRYSPATAQWTLQRGTGLPETTAPQWGLCALPADPLNNSFAGARQNNALWKLCEDLLVFYGGNLSGVGYNRDLYAYVPSRKGYFRLRTYVPHPTYGTRGGADTVNFPHVSKRSSSFVDKAGNLWLFGGDSANQVSNALWKFTPDIACFMELTDCYSTQVLTDLPNLQQDGDINLYPNPIINTRIVNLTASGNWAGANVTVTDLTGKVKAFFNLPQNRWELPGDMAPGLYLVTFQKKELHQTVRLVVLQ